MLPHRRDSTFEFAEHLVSGQLGFLDIIGDFSKSLEKCGPFADEVVGSESFGLEPRLQMKSETVQRFGQVHVPKLMWGLAMRQVLPTHGFGNMRTTLRLTDRSWKRCR